MPIDPKHFNKFMAIVAVVAAILIAFGTFKYISGRQQAFHEQMMEADTLGTVAFPDLTSSGSLQLNKYRGYYVLLDFWSDWSEPSLDSHEQLAAMMKTLPDTLIVVAAAVRTDSSTVIQYQQSHDYPFVYVDGTAFYERMNLPGIPSQVLFNPKGDVIATYVGYTDAAHYDSLRRLIK